MTDHLKIEIEVLRNAIKESDKSDTAKHYALLHLDEIAIQLQYLELALENRG